MTRWNPALLTVVEREALAAHLERQELLTETEVRAKNRNRTAAFVGELITVLAFKGGGDDTSLRHTADRRAVTGIYRISGGYILTAKREKLLARIEIGAKYITSINYDDIHNISSDSPIFNGEPLSVIGNDVHECGEVAVFVSGEKMIEERFWEHPENRDRVVTRLNRMNELAMEQQLERTDA